VRGTPALGCHGLAGENLTGCIGVARLALKEVARGAVSAGLEGGELGLVDLAGIFGITERLGRRIGLREMRGVRGQRRTHARQDCCARYTRQC